MACTLEIRLNDGGDVGIRCMLSLLESAERTAGWRETHGLESSFSVSLFVTRSPATRRVRLPQRSVRAMAAKAVLLQKATVSVSNTWRSQILQNCVVATTPAQNLLLSHQEVCNQLQSTFVMEVPRLPHIGSCFWKHVSPNECNLIHRWTSAFWHSLTWVFYDFTGATHTCKIENETVSESIEGHLSTGMMPPWPCRRHAADKHWQRLPCTDRSGWSGCCPEFFQSFVMSTGMAVSYTDLWTSYIAATEYSCFRTALFNPRLLESWSSLTPTLVKTTLRSAHCLPLLGKRRNVILFRERQGKCLMVWTRVSFKLCIDESMYLCMYVTVCLHVNL